MDDKSFREVVESEIMDAYGGFGDHYVDVIVAAHNKRVEEILDGIKSDIHTRAAQIANDPITGIQQLRSQHRDGQATINGLAWAYAQVKEK